MKIIFENSRPIGSCINTWRFIMNKSILDPCNLDLSYFKLYVYALFISVGFYILSIVKNFIISEVNKLSEFDEITNF